MTKPTWQDFATHDESIVPELWDGVVGAWAPCLGPTGSRLHDHSRRSNWGTLTNMDNATDWVVSDGQYALDFDGTNDAVFNSTVNNVTIGSSGFISCWCKHTGASAFRVAFSISADGNYFILGITSSNIAYAELKTTGSLIGFAPTPGIDIRGNWFHLCAGFGAGTGEMYVNGNFYNSQNVSGTLGTVTQIALGQSPFGSPWPGMVDDCTVWNRKLSATDARKLYQLGRGGMYQRRRRRAIYLPQAGFQSAWARGSNVLLGFNQP